VSRACPIVFVKKIIIFVIGLGDRAAGVNLAMPTIRAAAFTLAVCAST
jgi:hypothetical protein